MARIVAVHGIAQQVNGEETRCAEWLPALRDGLTRRVCARCCRTMATAKSRLAARRRFRVIDVGVELKDPPAHTVTLVQETVPTLRVFGREAVARLIELHDAVRPASALALIHSSLRSEAPALAPCRRDSPSQALHRSREHERRSPRGNPRFEYRGFRDQP